MREFANPEGFCNLIRDSKPTLPQVMTESIYWFEYQVETRFYVKTTSKPVGG